MNGVSLIFKPIYYSPNKRSNTMSELPDGYQDMEIQEFIDLGLDAKPWEFTHKDVMNLELVVYSYEKIETRYGDGYLAKAVIDGEYKKVLMGGKVLMRQLDAMQESLPVRLTVIKQGRYYKFS